ncbi:SGNH/GDSL hydrolase family protein [Nakamurella endophytica]|uniref:SGNH hydrolase-type esterase domain-containing protein n=1 Tax=Nakamurella endophytica TaxID=1748367 RepID=A0A917SKK3_9ACTN|nr:SGNH/GDSL hydrolase family protein [Nakamurella endophytica]GGL87140.1 hypothetical protein GCM10011594_03410 [Nakamurella endophytica]
MPADRRGHRGGEDAAAARAVVTAAAGAGLLAGLAGAALVALLRQAGTARQAIEAAALDAARAAGLLEETGRRLRVAELPVPRRDGLHLPDGGWLPLPDGGAPLRAPGGRPLVLAMLGDSTAVGYGVHDADELPAVALSRQLAAAVGRPVLLHTYGLVGAGAADLTRQVAAALPDAPDVAVIVIGANDVTDKVPPWQSAQRLGATVAALVAQGVPVVVGTCPDLGVIAPIPQPLRSVLHAWSGRLAALQARATEAAGGRAVPIGRLVSPGFAGHPELFADDGFHPSGAGYARAVAALLPEVVAAVGGQRPERAAG